MLPELPHEIWVHIISYIPDANLRKLYSLNHRFYEFAMDAKYKELLIANNPTRGQLINLYLARAPTVARRVRRLDIDLWPLHTIEVSTNERPSWKGRMQSIKKSLRHFVGRTSNTDPLSRDSRPVPVLFDELVDTSKHMDNVRHFHIRGGQRDIIRIHQDHLRHLWSSISKSVHSLYLHAPGEEINMIFAIIPDLSRLKHLSLDFRFDFTLHSHTIQGNGVLNRVAGTLESLRLTLVPDHESHYLLFKNLDHFSKLKHMELYLGFSNVTFPGMTKFINDHGGNITTLALKLDHLSEMIPLDDLQLPSLRHLTLDIYRSPIQSQSPLSGTPNFPSLDRLTIMGACPPQKDILSICTSFRQTECGSQVRDLHLETWILDGPILDSLASAFPRLRTLFIRSLSLCRDLDPWDLTLFADQMETRRYPQWQLHDLTVEQFEPELPPPAFDPISYAVMKIMAKSIPSIQSFYGSGHMDGPVATLP